MRVLLVEDDLRLARLIARVLEQEHFSVDLAFDGDTGLEFALTGAHRVALIDWMVPKHDGLEICRAVRAARLPLALLMLTACTQVEDRVLGLDSGADDYLIKPFAFSELIARVRALSRRFELREGQPATQQVGDIRVDVRSRIVYRAGVDIHLTETEWNLLECFIYHANQTLTRKQIFEQVWGVNSDAQLNMVDVYVSYLRHKLNTMPEHLDPIETVRGIWLSVQTLLMMFNQLRLRLTALYTLVAVVFVTGIASLAYGLLAYYFQSITDMALYHAMAHEYEVSGIELPSELATADIQWAVSRKRVLPLPLGFVLDEAALPSVELAEANDHPSNTGWTDHWLEEAYDGELTAIFIIPLDAQGKINAINQPPILTLYPHLPVLAAVQSALHFGKDMRTVQLDDHTHARILTYRLPPGYGEAVLQMGRVLDDQSLILRRLLRGTIGIGVVVLAVSAVSSWWFAGRSLRPAHEALERQQLFVANASHELRTPLTLIRASAEVVHDNLPYDQENRILLQDVMHEVDYMARLVDDLLLLSRLDAGRLVLERKEVSLPALLADSERQNAPLAKQHNLHIRAKEARGVAFADPTRLRQVLLILIENALQHTPAGGAIVLEAGQAGKEVWIAVCDTGEGIAPEHLPHLFDRFYQVENARNSKGAGLGLAIAKSLVEAQQGRIRIESQIGQGTTVKFWLPCASEKLEGGAM